KKQITQLQQQELDGLRQQLTQLQRDVDDLKARTANPPRVSGYTPQPAATGRVRIVNSYMVPETVVVNGRAYTVNPGTYVTTDPVPAGLFNYEVLGVQGPVSRALAANEMFTITIHP